MAHANAALTPRQRLRLARAVVEDGWTIAYAAAVFQVAWPTAKRWAVRYEQAGPAGMARAAAAVDDGRAVALLDRWIAVSKEIAEN